MLTCDASRLWRCFNVCFIHMAYVDQLPTCGAVVVTLSWPLKSMRRLRETVLVSCVTRRRQNKPSNTQECKQRPTQNRTTARSSANLPTPNPATHPRKTLRHNSPLLFSMRLRSLRQVLGLYPSELSWNTRPIHNPVPRDHEAGPRHSTVPCPSERSSGDRGTACAGR